MSRDLEICKEIAQNLFDAAPDGARKIFLKANLVGEGDVCYFYYDYCNKENEKNWFLPNSGALGECLTKLLLEHREFFVGNGHPPWKSCEFVLDVDKGKFSLDLNYESGD
jgi:hypothetical protein